MKLEHARRDDPCWRKVYEGPPVGVVTEVDAWAARLTTHGGTCLTIHETPSGALVLTLEGNQRLLVEPLGRGIVIEAL